MYGTVKYHPTVPVTVMPKDGYKSVSIPEEQHATASSYKPQNASWSWGDALVAGAERLNDDLNSDAQRFGEEMDADAVADAVAERIDADGGATDIDGVVADLKAELPGAVADEVEGRLR